MIIDAGGLPMEIWSFQLILPFSLLFDLLSVGSVCVIFLLNLIESVW